MSAQDRNRPDFTSRLAAFQNRTPKQDDPRTKGPGRGTVKERHTEDNLMVVAPSPKNLRKTKNLGVATQKTTRLKRTLLITALLFLLGCLGVGALVIAAVMNVPEWDPSLIDGWKEPAVVYDNNGQEFLRLDSTENRLAFKYEDLPTLLIETIIAIEKDNGETLESLLAQSVYHGYGFSPSHTFRMSLLKSRIKRNYSEEEIVVTYLTHLIFGNTAFGVRSASQIYCGKEPAALSVAEIALICGLPQEPGKNDPYFDPDQAQKRRTEVLDIMLSHKLITDDQYKQAKDEAFVFVNNVKKGDVSIILGSSQEAEHQYFVDYVVSALLTENMYTDVLGSGQDLAWTVYNSGLRIYTTVDPKIQKVAEEAIKEPAFFPEINEANPIQGAIVVLDNDTGGVAAMVGGREWRNQKRLTNRVLSKHEIGSLAGPLIAYAPAIEKGGYFAGSVFDDAPATFDGWTPKNANNRYNGLITMREALVNPANIYTVKLYQDVGAAYCWDFASNNLALDLSENEKSRLHNALGAFDATPLEMARAYSAFPNLGTINEPQCITKITAGDNEVLLAPAVKKTKAMKETTAFVVSDMMRSAVVSGNAKEAAIDDWYICGRPGTAILDPEKYGSSTGTPDAWFAGYSPAYTAVVWVGYDVANETHFLTSEYGGEFGGSKPAGLWNQIMRKAHEGMAVKTDLTKPADVVDIVFDALSGFRPSQLTPAALVKTEIGPGDGAPSQESDVWTVLGVDPDNPGFLAMPGSPSLQKTFLALQRDFWAEKELPYKPPTEVSTVNTIPRPVFSTRYVSNLINGQQLTLLFSVPTNATVSEYIAIVRIYSANPDGTISQTQVGAYNLALENTAPSIRMSPTLSTRSTYYCVVFLIDRATGLQGESSVPVRFTT
ncbi:MAG: penicillin-binding transpeptidase domain-containing protein [Peptococcaceae bacterium]|nr:penicillin-binding transpeptidase domain-containing protein [Peptococcaceae bacterium]